MGFWAWFWIWVALSIGALAVFGFIGKSLLNRAGTVLHQVERIMKPVQELSDALGTKSKLEAKESDLLTPVSDLDARRTKFLKQKSKKRAARQRSLRSALKHIDVNESRFTNV
jgi:heme exporter protein D